MEAFYSVVSSDFFPYIMLIIGFVLIIKGSDWFLDSAIWAAKILKVPDLIIGATLVSLCTTLPESFVSATSSFHHNSDIAFGNALGSIACNTGFILGITIMFSAPRFINRKKYQRNGAILMLCIFLTLGIVAIFSEIPSFIGWIFLAFTLLYILSNLSDAKKLSADNTSYIPEEITVPVPKDIKSILVYIFVFLIGLVFIISGSNILVENGERIAHMLGVSDRVIGVTVTAFGTSLPEFFTAITAIIKKSPNLSVGNIIGADILNIILVTGLSAVINPISIDPAWLTVHFPFVILISGLAIGFSFSKRDGFSRWMGLLLFGIYLIYVILVVSH